MLPRFLAPDAAADRLQTHITLPEDESRHAVGVLRLRAGDELAVFDGRGHEWRARITSTDKRSVSVWLEAPIEAAPEARVSVTLLHAVLKGDHMDSVVRDATMMGVSTIQPAITSHTAVRVTTRGGVGAQKRWLRIAVASAKQCRRAVVPTVREPVPLDQALASCRPTGSDARILLAEPAARHAGDASSLATEPSAAVVAIGPEGGWSRDELEQFAAARFVPLTLGALTLRADAAAIVALSVLRARWGDL